MVTALRVGCLLLGVLVVALLCAGCDPTEDTFAVTFRNDTSHDVELKQCDVHCDSFHERDRLRVGGVVKVNTSSADTANWWVVSEVSGSSLLGCINLRFDHKIADLVIDVSTAGACPSLSR